jgi:transcriptional pleiotropic regulator of transition state genes
MRDTGIVRRVDDLGRIGLPIESRRLLGINVKDPLAIYVEGNKIILTKHKDACRFCGSTENISEFKGNPICQTCIDDIKKK